MRYYRHNPVSYEVIGEKKAVEVWDAKKLIELKERRYWWHPHVFLPNTTEIEDL